MRDEKELTKYINNINKREILRFRDSYKENNQIDDYIFKTSKNIFQRLLFQYLKFEMMLSCVLDINENPKYYSKMENAELKRVNIISGKLEKICTYLNIAANEFEKMLLYVKK